VYSGAVLPAPVQGQGAVLHPTVIMIEITVNVLFLTSVYSGAVLPAPVQGQGAGLHPTVTCI